MKSFDLQALLHSDCPNLWHDLLNAGKVVGDRVEVPDAEADRILAGCPAGGHVRESMADTPRGLGDVIALVAQPVARAIDAVAGTHLKTCGGCQARQAKLNELMPFKRPLSSP
jgi:hypothetical protein